MRLYFLRHADAVDGHDDDARALSEEGREESEIVGKFLKRSKVRFDTIYSSPLVRAVQTAEIVLQVSQPEGTRLEIVESMRNEFTDFSKWLAGIPEADKILLVGHMPSIGERVARLLSIGNPNCLRFSKAALFCIETENRRLGVLRFFVTPKVLG